MNLLVGAIAFAVAGLLIWATFGLLAEPRIELDCAGATISVERPELLRLEEADLQRLCARRLSLMGR